MPTSKQEEDMNKESIYRNTVDANDVSLGDPKQKGLLSFMGDPAGRGLNKALSPAGKLVGNFITPFGPSDPDEAKNKEDREQTVKPIGGNEQNGENPLGL